MDDALGIFAAALFLAILITAMFVLPFVALAGVPLVGLFVGYRLWRDNPRREERLVQEKNQLLYETVLKHNTPLSDEEIGQCLATHIPGDLPEDVHDQFARIAVALYQQLKLDIPKPPPIANSIEGARYRDQLNRVGNTTREELEDVLDTISRIVGEVAQRVPRSGEFRTEATTYIDTPQTVMSVVNLVFSSHHFKPLQEVLDRNLEEEDGVLPYESKEGDIPQRYFKDTLLLDLFTIPVPFTIPEETRFEHTYIVAGSGHGKTQTLQHFIGQDLDSERSVIVIDSQGDLIRNILDAAPDPERVILIDPEDVEYPVCLNLFAVGQERMSAYTPVERERLINSVLELYDFVLGSLLQAGFTQKQSVVFRYVTRLLISIPGATIHTMRELLEEGGSEQYQEYIDQLTGTPYHFFQNEFDSKEFRETRKQILRRLYGILENQTFERMFTHEKSKLDLFTEMNAGKLILINTAKSLLKETGTQIFGRFFLALIAQAAQERAVSKDRRPVHVYVDEMHDYANETIAVILAQARKYNVGLMLAHQYLGQLDNALQDAIGANTAVKLAGGVSPKDARALAPQLRTYPDFILSQGKGHFATYVKGITQEAVSLRVPFGTLEAREKGNPERIRAISRERYAEPVQRNSAPHRARQSQDPDDVPESSEW